MREKEGQQLVRFTEMALGGNEHTHEMTASAVFDSLLFPSGVSVQCGEPDPMTCDLANKHIAQWAYGFPRQPARVIDKHRLVREVGRAREV